MEGIIKQAQHQLQQKREQRISLEKQLATIKKEEEEISNTIQYLTRTSNSESISESTKSPTPSNPSTPKRPVSSNSKTQPITPASKTQAIPSTSKTQASYTPSLEKEEFTKMEEDVQEIINNSSIGKKKWYVIFNGPFKGIYSDWALASPHITGQSVNHKSYTSKEIAEQALRESYKTVTTEEVQKSKRFISLNQRLQQEQASRRNPVDIIRSIPTTREREQMKRPSVEKFQNLWNSIIYYDEVQATKSFYPKDRTIGPKAVFLAGSAPTDVHEYFVHGLLDTVYTDGNSIRELQEFPVPIQNTVRAYNDSFAKNRPLYFSLHSSYPVFDKDSHKLLVPSIIIAELGVSNGTVPDRDEPEPKIPSDKNFVDALAGVFFASAKLGTGRKSEIRINYSGNNMLIYSNCAGTRISEEHQNSLAVFEEPFEKFSGILSALPEDFKIALCERLVNVDRHRCDYCSNAEMQE